MVLGSHLGVPCGLDLKSQSLVIESFSVGSRAVLSAWRSFWCFSRPRGSVGIAALLCRWQTAGVVRFPAGPRVRLKTVDPPTGNGLGQKKMKKLLFRDQQKKVVNVSLAFLRTGELAVCDIHSVWAVSLVILNEVEVCPLFAALRVFCHTQHIRNMHATWRVARPRNAVIYDVFALLPLMGRKKGRTPFKRLAVPKMRGKSAKHRKLQRCVAAQHAMLRACCVCVAHDKTHATLWGVQNFEMSVNIVTFSLVDA